MEVSQKLKLNFQSGLKVARHRKDFEEKTHYVVCDIYREMIRERKRVEGSVCKVLFGGDVFQESNRQVINSEWVEERAN